MTYPCMRGPADAVLLLPSHTKATEREFEAAVEVQKLLRDRQARAGGAGAGAADGRERPPSTDAADSREGSGRTHATATAAEGEGEAGRGEGSAAGGATARAREVQERAAAWLRSREEAGRLPEPGSLQVVARFVDAEEADADSYPGAPSSAPACGYACADALAMPEDGKKHSTLVFPWTASRGAGRMCYRVDSTCRGLRVRSKPGLAVICACGSRSDAGRDAAL